MLCLNYRVGFVAIRHRKACLAFCCVKLAMVHNSSAPPTEKEPRAFQVQTKLLIEVVEGMLTRQ